MCIFGWCGPLLWWARTSIGSILYRRSVRRLVSLLILSFFAGAAATCSNDGAETDDGCMPGLQVNCGCPGGGMQGVQICSSDGAGFGACMGCGVAGSEGTSAGEDSDGVTTSGASMGSSGAVSDGGEVTGPGGSEGGESSGGGESSAGSEGGESAEGGEPTFAWVWVDHGGPAFQPPPCAAMVGVVDGLLVDPQAFFNSLVEGDDPNDWVAVLNAIEPELWACGLGQQRDSLGNVRGRLFLPVAECPDASPPLDDPDAMFLGVRQEEACWNHFVDVVSEL